MSILSADDITQAEHYTKQTDFNVILDKQSDKNLVAPLVADPPQWNSNHQFTIHHFTSQLLKNQLCNFKIFLDFRFSDMVLHNMNSSPNLSSSS